MIKNGNIFFVSDENANVNSDKPEGLYLGDIRYISSYKVMWNEKMLYGTVEEENNMEKVVYEGDEGLLINIYRWIYKNSLYEKICFTNKSSKMLEGDLSIHHSHDFKDIFIVRNFKYGERGEIVKAKYKEKEFLIEYNGKDQIKRVLNFKGDGDVKTPGVLQYKIQIKDNEKKSFQQVWSISIGNKNIPTVGIEESFIAVQKREINLGYVYSKEMESLLVKSLFDIERLKSNIGKSEYIAAGVPLYSTLFGRDSIIAGLQLLRRKPELLKGTLELLARYQGKEINNYLEEEPGKILHELREGELANTKQVPFYPYYGSIDSTPLFLMGIAEYYNFTKDKGFLNNILLSAKKALNWLDEYGDKDGDGFVEYIRMSNNGSNNHGWKDSTDSMIHKDGSLSEGTVALAEVQGYVYKAKTEWSSIFEELGDNEMSLKLKEDAELLKRRFNDKFWMEDYFAMALDGEKNKLEVISSNPLHCLYCGIINGDKVPLVIKRAFKEDMFSSYGIRTISNLEKAYDPLSYHDGSIWPHDNSLIALGLKKYKYTHELEVLAEAIFRAGNQMKNKQMPELYGGEALKSYKEACVPQAWAAGAVILLNDLLE